MRSNQIVVPFFSLALLLGACSGGGDEGSAGDEATPGAATTAETSAEAAEAEPSIECALSVEQATELSGLQIGAVESRYLAADVTECRYFEGSTENSAPKFRYRFTPGSLKERDGELLTVAGSDARYSPTTGQLIIQVDEGRQLNVSGYAVERDNLVSIGEALVASGQ